MRSERVSAGKLIPGDRLIVPGQHATEVRDVGREGPTVVLFLGASGKPIRCTVTTMFLRVLREVPDGSR